MDDKANVGKEKTKQLMTAADGSRGLCVHIQLTGCKIRWMTKQMWGKKKTKQLMTAADGSRGLCVHIQLTGCKIRWTTKQMWRKRKTSN